MRVNRWMRMVPPVAVITGALAVQSFATTIVTGSHSGNGSGDGYTVTTGDYLVPPDTTNPAAPSATFNNNMNNGFRAGGTTTSVTIKGGQFNSNMNGGFLEDSGTASISGGEFESDPAYGIQIDAAGGTITGGTFSGNGVDAEFDANASIYGGTFGSNRNFAVFNGHTIDLYGSFDGVTPGTTETLSASSGSFTGTLQDASSSQLFRYTTQGGSELALHSLAAVPEPSSVAMLGIGASFLVCRRRRQSH